MVEKIKTGLAGILIGILVVFLFLCLGIASIFENMKRFKRKSKATNMTQMKKAVVTTAKALLVANNTVTTLEIKTKLRKDFAHFHWNQQTVSNMMDELAKKGTFTYTDNGTFRIYSDPKQPKRAAGKGVVVTAPTVVAPAVTIPVAKVKKTPVTKKVVKGGVVKTKTTKTKVVKNPLHNVKAISKSAAEALLLAAHGKFGSAEFVKRNSTLRKMNFKVLPGQTSSSLGYVKVIDVALYNKAKKAGKTKADAEKESIRNINLQTLKSLTLNSVTNTVR